MTRKSANYGSPILMLLLGFSADVFGEAIAITNNNAMNFLDAAQGDAGKTLTPASGSQFSVTGAPNAAYTLTIPNKLSIVNGATTNKVTAVTSVPTAGNKCCKLDGAGNGTVQIGATHAAVGATDLMGLYTGTFAVSVKYTAGGSPTATANGAANLTVIASIALTKVSDLIFGVCSPGDTTKVIAAGATGSAEFSVTGAANKQFTITLPGTFNMTTGAGGANRTISVSAFTSSPASPARLSGAGTATLYVGATRGTTTAAQVAGAYTAAFNVTVTYQ